MAMKASGVPWIGDIPSDWRLGRVKNDFYSTKTIVGDKADDYERLALTLGGVIKRSKEDSGGLQPDRFNGYQILKENELVFKLIDLENVSTSRVGLSPYTGLVSPAYIILHNRREKSPKYAEYYFLSMWMNEVFNHLGGDGVRSSLNAKDLLNVPFLLIPESEQQAIADYLDDRCSKIDEIIAEAESSIEEYINYRESIISNATTRGITNNREMKDSGINWLPKIPKEWEPITAKALFVQRKERAIPGEKQLTASQNLGIIYQEDYMRIQGTRLMVVQKDFDILKHVEPDDFVISMRSFQGGLEYSYLRGCISSAYVMLIPNHEYVYSEYYKWLFKSDKYINALQSTSDLIRDGQALRYANFVKLRLFKVPLTEQKEIAAYLNDIIPKVDALISEKQSLIDDLRAYKKSLIYEVVTGKRRVSDVN